MNVECQTIRVPTGVQDYRPALYGGIAAIELRRRRHHARRPRRRPDELEQRIVLAYTGAPRNSGTNNWEITKRHIDGDRHIFDCFERIRDTAVAMRDGARARRLGRSRPADRHRVGQPQAAGARRDDAGDRRADRARDGRGRDRRQGLRRRRRRLPVLLRPAARRGRRSPTRSPPAARACSTTGSRREGLRRWITSAIARILREIADLLEIKGENPFKIRAYRNGADIVANHPHELSRRSTRPELREIPGIGKDLAARIREIAETGDAEFHRELLAEFPPTILDLLHLQGVGPKTVAMLYRELGIRTLDDLERAANDGRDPRAARHGRRRRKR